MSSDVLNAEAELGNIPSAVIPHRNGNGSSVPANVLEHRDILVKEYYGGSGGLLECLKEAGNTDAESLLVALLDEVIKESDHLLGNQLVAAGDGELQIASVISFKRAEVLEKAIKAVQSKQAFEKDSGFDLNSPSVMVLYRFFMKKVHEVFGAIGVRAEQKDLFFQRLGEAMEDWQKELRNDYEELRKA
jgi:hypothetical protein